jgi:flagellar biosynthesis protein FlhG
MSMPTNVARHPAAAQRVDNAIAVASGKGGVGKTWFAITLAHALAARGRRMLLFDGDLGLANIDVQLGLMPRHDIAAVISGKASFADAIQRFEAGGFDILAGRSGSGSLAALPPDRLKGLRDGLAEVAARYDNVVLDLAAGLDENLRLLAGVSGTCLVIVTDEPTALTDAYALIKVLAAAGRSQSLKVVVNQAASQADGERTHATLVKACETFLKITPPLAGVVRRDDRVREAIRRQVSVFSRHPASAAVEDVARIAARLIKET